VKRRSASLHHGDQVIDEAARVVDEQNGQPGKAIRRMLRQSPPPAR
jgi:hypothetical protein